MEWFATYIIAPLVVSLVLVFLVPRTRRRIWRSIKTLKLSPAAGTHFTVLIADLVGDDVTQSQTRRIERALEDQPGLRTRRIATTLPLRDVGDTRDNRAAAEARGRDWLDEHQADVLIWGEVSELDRVLELRFLGAPGGLPSEQRPYVLDPHTLRLPADFQAAVGEVVHALTLVAVAPAAEPEVQYIVEHLRPVIQKVARLVDRPPEGLSGEQVGQIRNAFGIAAVRLGEQSGAESWLERGSDAFRANLATWTKERAGDDWAMTQHNLGTALGTLGEREEGTARLEEAVAAFRAALEVYTRDRLPAPVGDDPEQPGHRASDVGGA